MLEDSSARKTSGEDWNMAARATISFPFDLSMIKLERPIPYWALSLMTSFRILMFLLNFSQQKTRDSSQQ